MLQEEIEREEGAPMPRNARVNPKVESSKINPGVEARHPMHAETLRADLIRN
jgi:hypothetical protein